MTKRLFIAINLPNEIKIELADLVLKLQKANKNKSIKWVAPDNFHLTLHFLGSVNEEKIEKINNILNPIISNFPTLKMQLSSSINAFPSLDNPKVIFLEIKELNNNINDLHKKIGESLTKLDFEINQRPFRLHLTLGRVKHKTNIQLPRINISETKFRIQTIDLMVSQLTPQGPIYTIISQYNLV